MELGGGSTLRGIFILRFGDVLYVASVVLER